MSDLPLRRQKDNDEDGTCRTCSAKARQSCDEIIHRMMMVLPPEYPEASHAALEHIVALGTELGFAITDFALSAQPGVIGKKIPNVVEALQKIMVGIIELQDADHEVLMMQKIDISHPLAN